MASGKTHDQSIYMTFPLYTAVLLLQGFSIRITFISAFCYLFGGLMLSPDIDMSKSRPSQRYGLLKFYWMPYQKLFPHRGNFFNRNFFTHFPIIGTAIRLAYFSIPFLVVAYYNGLNLSDYYLYVAILGITTELASLLHLALDIVHTLRKR